VIRTVLAIDTATAAVITGVVRRRGDGQIDTLAECITEGAHAHAEQLTPNVLAAVGDAGLTLEQVDAIFNAADVTEQEPFTAMARMGLQLVQEPSDGQ
jgi:tRNA A37 threonylcarbamoyladenosine modification protein TsaB